MMIFRVVFQLQVIGYDSAYPSNTAMETLTITVNRNPNPPKFPTSFYNVTIPDVFSLVTPIVQVYAADYLDGVLSLSLEFY